MECHPTRLSTLQSLKARLLSLKCVMDRAFLWTKWVRDNRDVFGALQSRTYSGGTWTVVWLSTPGQYFSVQQSADGLSWITVAVAVPASASPAKTTAWVSPALPAGELFFRIKVLPEGFQPCYSSFGIANVPGWDPRADPLASLS